MVDVGEEDRKSESPLDKGACDAEDCQKCPVDARKDILRPIPGNQIPVIPGLSPYHPYYQFQRHGSHLVGQLQHHAGAYLSPPSGNHDGRCPSPTSTAAVSLAAMRNYLLATQHASLIPVSSSGHLTSSVSGQTTATSSMKTSSNGSERPRELAKQERLTPPASIGAPTAGSFFLYNPVALAASLATMQTTPSNPHLSAMSGAPAGIGHGPKFATLGQFNPRESL